MKFFLHYINPGGAFYAGKSAYRGRRYRGCADESTQRCVQAGTGSGVTHMANLTIPKMRIKDKIRLVAEFSLPLPRSQR
jgi:hypothetical protein